MADIVDVVAVRDLRTAQPGDLLVHGDAVVGHVISGRPGEIRVQLERLPDRVARWSWDLDKIDCDRGTVPILAGMRRVLAEHGIEVGDRFQITREV